MDLSSLIDLMQQLEPGAVVEAEMKREDDLCSIEFTVKRVSGKEVAET